ncbi:citron rho-interacting kinase isoform X2 [Manduca sexta]|uniref:Citron Rho-interacting kinase n=1 Tax=Manduca sexta TaxID=7130 RepID=A0A922CHC5_MANSE|nr:citron rho-interacting kinase isoform X2 [Manduca sexta]KAG6446840.1 hypothetical protein O3G_MSEX004609 [Manduca sexta]
MEPSKEAITLRITRLNRQILGKVTSGTSKFSKRTLDREALLDALTVLYDECNDDPVKKTDELVRAFVDKYRSTLAELRRTRVCYSDFEVLQTIGRGYFGEVHMVKEKQTGDVYALKTLRKEQARKQEITSVEDERDVLAAATSPWLPRLQYAFQDSNNLYLVMELCYGGDLAGLLARRNHPLSERDAAFYVAEVAHALKALHGMGYVHRDVKPHNILLDRCGHVKLGDLGSVGRLSGGGAAAAAGTADYVAPELLAAAHCAATHSSACDYWSLGVVAFELVTLKRPFSKGDEDSMIEILSNIQKYERSPTAEPPFEPPPHGPSAAWRSLVGGLLRVQPARRYSYLDTLQHQALAHIPVHSIRDQVPPWVPLVRGAEDASWLVAPPRRPAPPSAAPFRTRPPFAGQLPFVGYSYVAPEDNDDSSGGFNASHDCTAIDLATFKSLEKLATMRSREIASLQGQLASAEASTAAAVERTRRELESDAERQRARLQADITALTLQNKRLERQVEVEKEERMALQRSNQELSSGIAERNNIVAREARAEVAQLQAERDGMREDMRRLETRIEELQAECASAVASAEAQRAQHQHYKNIIEQVRDLRHRRLTEINVRAIDSVAKERAIRRQTLSGSEAEVRDAAARVAAAEASAAREARAREHAESTLAALEQQHRAVQDELDKATRELAAARESLSERQRVAETSSDQLKEVQQQLAQERFRASSLQAQVQELERGVEESARREAALEEQGARTESRLHDRLTAAEARAADALHEDARHREKVNTLEQLVRQLEREVTALENRVCTRCAARAAEEQARTTTGTNTSVTTRKSTGITANTSTEAAVSSTTATSDSNVAGPSGDAGAPVVREGRDSTDTARCDAHSDTESLADAAAASVAHAQLSLLKEQLERAETQLQARSEEIATLRQETRAANLARWRKEREYNELSVEAKSTARDLKRVEERVSGAIEARKAAEQKAASLQSELTALRPQYEQASAEAARLKEQLDKLKKMHEGAQAEVDRSRNDIRKLKSELQYSEKRRLHAEEQEELSSRERAQLRDELQQVRQHNTDLTENNKALQEACSLLEEQLTDLERLTDIHEVKNKDLESEVQRMRSELESCRARLADAERAAVERAAAADTATHQHMRARDEADHAACQLQLLQERLETRSQRVSELETSVAALEGALAARDAALRSAARRTADLLEESAALRTRAHHHHSHALALQAQLAEVQEELAAAREAAEAATAWWRTREAKSDATLRQQTKLIDFLQAKVEEANRKKCSLSNKLFGRSGRRNAASPPLRRANRELREEVERLRAKLATNSTNGDSYPPTPRREKPKPLTSNGFKSIDTPDSVDENTLQIVWPDGVRERYHANCANGVLVLTSGAKELRAKLHHMDPKNLPQNESNRAFSIKLENSALWSEAAVVCATIAARALWVSRLSTHSPRLSHSPRPPRAAARYTAAALTNVTNEPYTALYLAPHVFAIGCADGLYSLRTGVDIVWEISPPRTTDSNSISCLSATCGRALLVCGGVLAQAGLLQLGSTMRRASNLHPTVTLSPITLPDSNTPHIVKALSGDTMEGPCAAVASGRRVFLLRFDAAASEFKIFRSLTVDRLPNSLLLTNKCLYVAGEKPLKINLPSGALESFAMDELTVAAAARKHSPPKAILLIREKPIEILLCYAECGVFVDENGKRTRNEDPKWSSAIHAWEFINPFLYLVGEEKVTILYINEEVYKAPPCTCDTTSLTSTETDCCNSPQTFNLKLQEPQLLGTTPNGIIIRSKTDEGYEVSVIEGMPAFKSIGASIESLETISDTKGSSSDLAQSVSDLSPQEVSQESIEMTTGFLADIRKKARQLRLKNRKEQNADDVIKEILTTEVSLNRTSTGRKSPATNSEFDSDSTESEERTTNSTKCTADVCAEIFARQVRFQ